MLNIPKNVYTFRTKISDSIKNYVQHGKNQPHQEVGGGYTFVKHCYAHVLPVIELIP